jgi:ATP/maltotriose-dependent transcriptional regulator MalT/DNA-binding SARP family transcriptional activator
MAAGNPTARALAAKILLPAVPPMTLARPTLESRLDEVLDRRLALVIAGAGYGKSTLVAGWAERVHAAWYALTPEDCTPLSLAAGMLGALRLRVPALPSELGSLDATGGPEGEADVFLRAELAASILCELLANELGRELVLVVEDVNELVGCDASLHLLESLCSEAPPGLHLILTSRTELPFGVDRLRGRGQTLELGPAELAFSAEEISALLPAESKELASQLRSATDGWPVAVRLAIEALRTVPQRERPSALARLRRSGGPLYSYLAAEVLEQEPPETQELLQIVATLGQVTPGLLDALCVTNADRTIVSLARRGLFLELTRAQAEWYSPTELIRGFLITHRPLDYMRRQEVHRQAAAWLEEHGFLAEALRSLRAIDDQAGIARLLGDNGRALLRAGAPGTIIEAGEAIPPQLRTEAVEEVEGAARQIRGDWEGALACFRRIAADEGPLPAGLAWRMGVIHYFRGRLDEALALFARGRLDGKSPQDEALLLAWQASVHWMQGDSEACRSAAERAFAIATSAGDEQALAAAHTVLAMLAALEGDRGANDAHYLRALEHAQRARDLLQVIRIHTNRASLHLEEGSYKAALTELEQALPLADLAGFASFHALGLTNRGEAQLRLGRLEEAMADLQAAKAIYQRMGSRNVCYPLQKLGDLYLTRGDLALARGAYEESAALGAAAGDQQALVPSLAGLARVLAGDEPEEAAALAERARAAPAGVWTVGARVAAARVAIGRGDRKHAAELAAEAAGAARARRDRAGLADALEVQGLAAERSEDAAALFKEARAIWREIGSPIGEAHCDLELARLGGPDAASLAASAQESLSSLGARGFAAEAATFRASLERAAGPRIFVRTLGGFGLLRDGEPVPLTEWQSKKARDLLKILVARRGRPTPREMLMEALWPDDDPRKLPNRLSVALATVRSVLDPERHYPADHLVGGEKSTLRLHLEHVTVDVECFLEAASEGLELARANRPEASDRLATAEVAYTGDFLEEDLYEDWAEPLREEAQAAYLEVVRVLATTVAARGDRDSSTRYLLRVLERDPYDEPAHLALVHSLEAAGRHGEARRFYRAYRGRMREIGVDSAPFPGTAAA